MLLFCAVAHSQEPPPTPRKEGQPPKTQTDKGRQKPQPDQRGTEGSPLVIKGIPPPPKTQAETDREAREREEKATNERGLTFYTGTLALFTAVLVVVAGVQAGLFVWQLRLIRQSAKDSAILAEAARLQAKAAMGVVLPMLRSRSPILYPVPVQRDEAYGEMLSTDTPAREMSASGFDIKNVGGTPAYPTKFMVGWAVCERLTGVPEYTASEPYPYDMVIDEGRWLSPKLEMGIRLTDTQIKSLVIGDEYLWIFGALIYSDFLEEIETTYRFCWRWTNIKRAGSPFFQFTAEGEPPKAYVQKTLKERAGKQPRPS